MKLKLIFIYFVILALVLGCAKPQIAEMDNARDVVFRAENDEDAVLYGRSSLVRARDALQRMQVEADSKRYDAAKTHAAEAITAAERAITEGRTGAARARSEAESLLVELRPALEETARNINGARYSLLDIDYTQLNRDLISASDTLDNAEADYADGRYMDAADKGRTTRAIIGSINEKITSAATISSRKK